jgi:hypothetical protein
MRGRWGRFKERVAVARLPRAERLAAKAERRVEAQMRAERDAPIDARFARQLAAEAEARRYAPGRYIGFDVRGGGVP